MISQSKKLFPNKPFRVVSRWCWADIAMPPEDAEEIQRYGFQLAFVYADKIEQDEQAPWDAGLSVRTTLLVEFHHKCIFSTRNTNYIHLGRGSRMTVDLGVFTNLTF